MTQPSSTRSLACRLRWSARTTLVAAALGASTLVATGEAGAVPCDTTTGQVLYIAGPDSMRSVLSAVAAAMWGENVHIFYKGFPSCLGIEILVNNQPTTPDPAEIGTPSAHEVSYWPGDAAVEMVCDLPYDMADPAEPELVPDIVLSEVFATTCAGFPNGLGSVQDFQGPVLGFGFIVPPASSAQSISAEAAYLVYGFGAASHQVAPWDDPLTILHRDANSGAENIFAKTLNLDVAKFSGTSLNSTGTLINTVAMATGPAIDSSIGGANLSVLDQRRADVRVLPYQHYEQTCGYYPDSTPEALDKKNIRDGHYPMWGVVHILTRTDAGGLPLNPGANRFINLVLGNDEIADLDPIALEAASSLIPQCAMSVVRSEDGGPLSSLLPARPCGCYYESLTGGTLCQACSSSTECPAEAPECSYGYCEP